MSDVVFANLSREIGKVPNLSYRGYSNDLYSGGYKINMHLGSSESTRLLTQDEKKNVVGILT